MLGITTTTHHAVISAPACLPAPSTTGCEYQSVRPGVPYLQLTQHCDVSGGEGWNFALYLGATILPAVSGGGRCLQKGALHDGRS